MKNLLETIDVLYNRKININKLIELLGSTVVEVRSSVVPVEEIKDQSICSDQQINEIRKAIYYDTTKFDDLFKFYRSFRQHVEFFYKNNEQVAMFYEITTEDRRRRINNLIRHLDEIKSFISSSSDSGMSDCKKQFNKLYDIILSEIENAMDQLSEASQITDKEKTANMIWKKKFTAIHTDFLDKYSKYKIV